MRVERRKNDSILELEGGLVRIFFDTVEYQADIKRVALCRDGYGQLCSLWSEKADEFLRQWSGA